MNADGGQLRFALSLKTSKVTKEKEESIRILKTTSSPLIILSPFLYLKMILYVSSSIIFQRFCNKCFRVPWSFQEVFKGFQRKDEDKVSKGG